MTASDRSSKHTLSVLVEDNPGVLTRISALFSRRGFNIDSLAVGPTEHPDVSRITVVVDVEDHPLEQVTKQLNKLLEVLKVVELDGEGSVQRKIVLVKVRADRQTRGQVVEVVAVVDHPPRAVRQVEVRPEADEGGDDGVGEADPSSGRVGPAGVGLDVLADGVLRVPDLPDRVDGSSCAAALDRPLAVVDAGPVALDLHDDDTDVGHDDHEVGLVVLGEVGEAVVGEEHVLGTKGVAQPLPHVPLGVRREGRVFGDQPWHGVNVASCRVEVGWLELVTDLVSLRRAPGRTPPLAPPAPPLPPSPPPRGAKPVQRRADPRHQGRASAHRPPMR